MNEVLGSSGTRNNKIILENQCAFKKMEIHQIFQFTKMLVS